MTLTILQAARICHFDYGVSIRRFVPDLQQANEYGNKGDNAEMLFRSYVEQGIWEIEVETKQANYDHEMMYGRD